MDIIIDQFPKLIRDRLKNHVKKIILFGSRARGNFNPEKSDYDFVLIVDERNKHVENTINEVGGSLLFEYSELVSSIVWDEKEWEDRKRYPIGINILKDGKEL